MIGGNSSGIKRRADQQIKQVNMTTLNARKQQHPIQHNGHLDQPSQFSLHNRLKAKAYNAHPRSKKGVHGLEQTRVRPRGNAGYQGRRAKANF